MSAYDFCVVRIARGSESRGEEERFHARFRYGAIDPGREAARLIIYERFRQSNTLSIEVNNYSEAECPGPEVQELTVTASIQQIEALASKIASGDLAGAAVTAADIVAGGAVSLVKGAGGFVHRVLRIFKRIGH